MSVSTGPLLDAAMAAVPMDPGDAAKAVEALLNAVAVELASGGTRAREMRFRLGIKSATAAHCTGCAWCCQSTPPERRGQTHEETCFPRVPTTPRRSEG